ncbi:AAA family ATPase [Mesorhizobium sp. A623]
MADTTLFQSLTLEGFRAYLQPKTFDFSQKRCLAIFAPNGSGKSSVIDALEFLFSDHGTLDRLGQRSLNNQAGPTALAHYGAQAAGIAPVVRFSTTAGKTITTGSRAASGSERSIHAAATEMAASFVVSPIIRGYTLRTFVETTKPETRYSDVAGWLQLTSLVEVQKNLRALRKDVKATAESKAELTRLDGEMGKQTCQVVQSWDAPAVLAYVNDSVIAPLDKGLTFAAFQKDDLSYAEVEKRVQAEENRIGLAGLKQARAAAAALWLKAEPEIGGDAVVSGAIYDFEVALAEFADARVFEADERDKAAGAVFRTIWNEAETLFADDAGAPDACPICTTPINQTTAGSTAAIRDLLAEHLADLKAYGEAKSVLDTASTTSTQAHNRLVARLPGLIEHLNDDDESGPKSKLIAYQAGVSAWPVAEAPASADIIAVIAAMLADLDEDIAAIEAKQGDHTWVKAKVKIAHLLELQDEIVLAVKTSEELTKLYEALGAQAKLISDAIRHKMQALLDTLQVPMNDIYNEIQGANARAIRLELPGDDEATQNKMQLVIDFAKNRTGVAPGGYLSDSQIHSVALALRLAAIKAFNGGAPVIALDDIVTSYDADHRRAIGALIAKMFGDCQIILVTHDERFFNYLKDQLQAKDWHFTRIIAFDPAYGPRFADNKVTDEMIEARWVAGELAANEMRQAEEEWLLGLARGFGVSVRIRPLEKAYSYERAELASAIGSMLSGLKLVPGKVPGVNNRFIDSLIKGNIENFGSHFQDGPYGDGSMGDEKARWEEFKAFREQFKCGACGRMKYQRPFGLNKPVCAHGGCETQFAFAATPAVA